MHKNWRFLRFDDVDMGDEVEAAIYNNNGKSAPESLKKFVNETMSKLMSEKLNQINKKVKGEEIIVKGRDRNNDKKRTDSRFRDIGNEKIDVSELID